MNQAPHSRDLLLPANLDSAREVTDRGFDKRTVWIVVLVHEWWVMLGNHVVKVALVCLIHDGNILDLSISALRIEFQHQN